MKKLVFIVLFSCGNLFAQNNQDLFNQATKAYSTGDYQTAIEFYEQIIDHGKTSVALYYNLANAHYKLNHVAPSIYYYEKALQLNPNDPDVQNNLGFAKKMTLDAIAKVPDTNFFKSVGNLLPSLEIDTWAWTSVTASFLFTLFLLTYYFSSSSRRKRLFFSLAILFFIVGIISVSMAKMRYDQKQNTQYAIVFAKETNVNSEPDARGDKVFTLHEGTKVKLKETYDGWFKIQLSDGKQGWIKKETVKKL